MKAAWEAFERNLARARELGGLYRVLSATTTPALDATDLLRAELVLATSSFDHLVHELARKGMLETFAGGRKATAAYQSFLVPLVAVAAGIAVPTSQDWLDQAIRDSLGWRTFQKPEKVAEAIRLIYPNPIWEVVAKSLHQPAGTLKTRLTIIVDRRNKIAHEADLDPTDASLKTRWPITDADVADAVRFLDSLGGAIYRAVA